MIIKGIERALGVSGFSTAQAAEFARLLSDAATEEKREEQ